MLDRKNLFTFFCALVLLLAAAAFSPPRHAVGQTLPSRTPVPDGGGPDPEPEPTDDNGGGGGGDNQPDPTDEPDPGPDATDTPQPQATAVPPTTVPPTAEPTNTPFAGASATPATSRVTPTASATALPASATPVVTVTAEVILPTAEVVAFPDSGQNFPQAGQCGMPPTYTTTEAISVYSGPGEAYPLIGLLGAGETRPIVGRAAFTTWWVLQLDSNGRAGWVSDETGTIHGFIGRVPIISAPDLNGAAPTPSGSSWSPTPMPECNAPELLAGVAAGRASDDGIVAAVPPSGRPEILDGLPQYDDATIITSDEADGVEAVTIQSSGEQAPASADSMQSKRQSAADPVINELAESAAPLDLPASTPSQPFNLMPIAGLVLILAAVFIGLTAKRNRSSASE